MTKRKSSRTSLSPDVFDLHSLDSAKTERHLTKLPRMCFSLHPISKQLVTIVAGQSGFYYATASPVTEAHCDTMNAGLGVVRGVRLAMEAGSMFGWGCPACDPDNYAPDGTYLLAKR